VLNRLLTGEVGNHALLSDALLPDESFERSKVRPSGGCWNKCEAVAQVQESRNIAGSWQA